MKSAKKILTAVAVALVLAGCSDPVVKYSDFLYEYMPLPDRLVHPADWWSANVQKTLEVRERMGWDVPEREFLHFVLPLRVNNEALDDFRLEYADTLCSRVEGMAMADAALEINHWCHEMATYRPSDARTSSPLATIRSGFGRCGEESVLTVAAMRAAGIPARQVYTPRWAHSDDNHAWVEVFVDGGWHFLGACEPEAVLDLGWFNGPVSRTLLLHTKVFGDYHGEEDVISRTSAYTEINVIRGYVPARRVLVTVLDEDGLPVEGADVEFKIYNYAEYYTVAKYLTDGEGHASLDTGLGDIVIWASKDDRFGLVKGSSDDVKVTLSHKAGEEFSIDFDIVPPPENPIPANVTEEQINLNRLRLAAEDSLREARPKGNDAVLKPFVNSYGDKARAILNSLSVKDLNDVTRDVLEDAASHCGESFDEWVDCPRIELEALFPYFSVIGSGLSFDSASEVYSWVCENIEIDDASNPQGLRIPPVFVWRSRLADSRSRDIFFVALCRSLGFAARIDGVTGKAQYLESGLWKDVELAAVSPHGSLAVSGEYLKDDPLYYTNFTISKIEGGSSRLLSFDEQGALELSSLFAAPVNLDEGYYMMTTGRRLADGSVLAHSSFFNVGEGEDVFVPMILRSQVSDYEIKGVIDMSESFQQASYQTEIEEVAGEGLFVLAVLGARDEPSVHARGQLSSAAASLAARNIPAIVLSDSSQSSMPAEIPFLSGGVYGIDMGRRVEDMIMSGVGAQGARLPLISVCDRSGRILYFSQGYNTSLSEDIKNIVTRF